MKFYRLGVVWSASTRCGALQKRHCVGRRAAQRAAATRQRAAAAAAVQRLHLPARSGRPSHSLLLPLHEPCCRHQRQALAQAHHLARRRQQATERHSAAVQQGCHNLQRHQAAGRAAGAFGGRRPGASATGAGAGRDTAAGARGGRDRPAASPGLLRRHPARGGGRGGGDGGAPAPAAAAAPCRHDRGDEQDPAGAGGHCPRWDPRARSVFASAGPSISCVHAGLRHSCRRFLCPFCRILPPLSHSACVPCPHRHRAATVYLVQGLLGLSRLAVFTFLKDDLALAPATVALITSAGYAPWVRRCWEATAWLAVPLDCHDAYHAN